MRIMTRSLARLIAVASLCAAASMAGAQLLPQVGAGLDGLRTAVPDALGRVTDAVDLARLSPAAIADRLAAARSARIATLLRRHGDRIELDDRRAPARRGFIVVTGAGAGDIDALRKAGFVVAEQSIEGIDLRVAQLTVPEGKSLSRALGEVRAIAPGAQASGDTLYFPSGRAMLATGAALAAGPSVKPGTAAAGIIDGGVARHPALSGPVEQRGFASGAPRASAHGTAVASLMVGNGSVRGAAPGAPLLVADVYGDDPAGGSALGIARALGWMAARKVRVVTISLVGPDNPILSGAIDLAREKGVLVVAAVGNDGPAAPPAYPASYTQVVAVTGIDGRGRLLPEAGKARHVDFAAPGADMNAATVEGGRGEVRGTSFAAPLVAGRLLALGSMAALRAEAKAGKKGMGGGIICDTCRNID